MAGIIQIQAAACLLGGGLEWKIWDSLPGKLYCLRMEGTLSDDIANIIPVFLVFAEIFWK